MAGRLDLTTALGLGTAPLGSLEGGPLWWGPQDRGVAVAAVRAAADAGVGWIDTAPFYGWGRAEEIVGEALHGRGDRPLVLTKCGTVPAATVSREDASPASVRRDVEDSLRRLRVDRLDAVQVHDPDPAVPIEETWGALHDLVAEGLVGAVGLSNHDVDSMERALAVGPVHVVQHQWSLLWRAPERDGVLDWCRGHGVPFLAWSPLASGFLTDGFDLDVLHPSDLRRRLRWATRDGARTTEVRRRLASVAERHDTTLVAVALAWITMQGAHAIVGARTPSEAAVLAAPAPRLDADDLTALDVPGG
jgi:aryl-alcohol dehydrogenase-like predicted oxidoreductase